MKKVSTHESSYELYYVFSFTIKITCWFIDITARKCYDVLRKKINLVGRAGFSGDFEIPGDSSISRCHAEIFYEKQVWVFIFFKLLIFQIFFATLFAFVGFE